MGYFYCTLHMSILFGHISSILFSTLFLFQFYFTALSAEYQSNWTLATLLKYYSWLWLAVSCRNQKKKMKQNQKNFSKHFRTTFFSDQHLKNFSEYLNQWRKRRWWKEDEQHCEIPSKLKFIRNGLLFIEHHFPIDSVRFVMHRLSSNTHTIDDWHFIIHRL